MACISSTNNKSRSTKKIHNIFSQFLTWCDWYKSDVNSGLCENNVILCKKIKKLTQTLLENKLNNHVIQHEIYLSLRMMARPAGSDTKGLFEICLFY